MNPILRLKLAAIAFTVFWTGGMLWWDGSFDRVHVGIFAIGGCLAGYGWYRAMRWQFQRMGMLARNEPSVDR